MFSELLVSRFSLLNSPDDYPLGVEVAGSNPVSPNKTCDLRQLWQVSISTAKRRLFGFDNH